LLIETSFVDVIAQNPPCWTFGMSGAHVSPLAGKPLDPAMLVDPAALVSAYYSLVPDPAQQDQRVHFGTSGHRGSSLRSSFNEAHVIALAQSVCVHRRQCGIDGPLFLGADTHALSEPALSTALEVFVANDVVVMVDASEGFTPTPAISHAILTFNRGRRGGLADGIVLTPSHNPPEDGGFKYNPPNGGPADTKVTGPIEAEANRLLELGPGAVRRVPLERARLSECLRRHDFLATYVSDLSSVVDMEAIRASGLSLGIDPLGGASVRYWSEIIDRYDIKGELVEDKVDPTFGFMPADWDGKIRMDCSSPYAMTRLIGLRDRFDLAVGNDTDADRHGIVTPSSGLMQPNHFLAAAIMYLFEHRPGWDLRCGIGKTMVSSAMIDRIASHLGRRLVEVPVGFKWFVEGLHSGELGFAGEESAGASLLRRNGLAWTTDKDGIALGLLAAEITASCGRDPGELYDELAHTFGRSWYERVDAPATPAQMSILRNLSANQVDAAALAGEPIMSKESAAPGGGQPLGGIRISTANGWFAARPSGTEALYKIYAESFIGPEHLARIQQDARSIVGGAFAKDEGVPGESAKGGP
jgi:phosphoglucomutase